jgi:hypothetical protein
MHRKILISLAFLLNMQIKSMELTAIKKGPTTEEVEDALRDVIENVAPGTPRTNAVIHASEALLEAIKYSADRKELETLRQEVLEALEIAKKARDE